MHVLVVLSTTLRDLVPDYNPKTGLALDDVREGVTAGQLAEACGIPVKEIKIIMINGRSQGFDAPVRDGDRVAFFPPVGGG